MASYGDDIIIDEVREYEKHTVSSTDFVKIHPGMGVFDVVSLVGLPVGTFTSGLCTLDFADDSGAFHRVLWDAHMTVTEVYDSPRMDG